MGLYRHSLLFNYFCNREIEWAEFFTLTTKCASGEDSRGIWKGWERAEVEITSRRIGFISTRDKSRADGVALGTFDTHLLHFFSLEGFAKFVFSNRGVLKKAIKLHCNISDKHSPCGCGFEVVLS